MAAGEPDIQKLRTELQVSRWQLHDSIQQLEDRFNVAQRIKAGIAAHPARWLMVALGVGLSAALIAPKLARAASGAWKNGLVSPALRLAFMAALPALTRLGAPIREGDRP